MIMSLEVQLLELLSSVPPWLSTIIISCLPLFELRGSIPIALGIYGLPPLSTYLLAVFGNMLPVIPLLLFLEPVSIQMRRYAPFDRFFSWLFSRTHRNHSESFEKYGILALLLFVAIPLPATGAWSGCAAAFVFGIKFKHAFPAILAGVMIAGIIVSIVTLTGISLFDLFLVR
jgi:uncharacterized membrane protein